MAHTDDRFKKFEDLLESPGKFAFNITPSDETQLTIPTRGVYVGATGNLCVRLVGNTLDPSDTETMGSNVEFINVTAGTLIPLRIAVVHSSNATGGKTGAGSTTAKHLIGLY